LVSDSVASTPAYKILALRGFGSHPIRRMATSTGPDTVMVRSARVNSSSRSSGHSPMNLVVTCSFSAGVQWSFASGRNRSSSSANRVLTALGISMAAKSRKIH
jgi:hypothetical protein